MIGPLQTLQRIFAPRESGRSTLSRKCACKGSIRTLHDDPNPFLIPFHHFKTVAEPQEDQSSEDPTFANHLVNWAEGREPEVTKVEGVREYTTTDMKAALREEVNGRIGTGYSSSTLPWCLLSFHRRTSEGFCVSQLEQDSLILKHH